MTTRLAALIAILVALFCATPAYAHSVLVSSSPAKDASLSTAPDRIVLEFNEPLEKGFTELTVLGQDGSHWEGTPASIVDASLSAPLRPLGPAGVYTIHYRIISEDGHPVSGAVPFTLTAAGTGAAAPATVAVAPESGVPVWPWVMGGAILLATGFAVARRVARTT